MAISNVKLKGWMQVLHPGPKPEGDHAQYRNATFMQDAG